MNFLFGKNTEIATQSTGLNSVCTLIVATVALIPLQGHAQINADGTFRSSTACEATQSLTSGNPGMIETEIDRDYQLLGLNRQPATHYLIKVPEAPDPLARWVPVSCGTVSDLVVDAGDSSGSAFRFVTVSGNFAVTSECDALKRTDAASDGVTVKPGGLFGMSGRDGSSEFFQISVPVGDRMRNRWVRAECGIPDLTYDADAGIGVMPNTIEHTLAASWQPGFCATKAGTTNDGCLTIVDGEPATSQFSLHGLWPDDLNTLSIFPCNCHLDTGPTSCTRTLDVNEPVSLPTSLAQRLDTSMPGSRGNLEEHEWTKHGTCYERYETGPNAGSDDDEYYEDSLDLLEQLNASGVQGLFEKSLGRTLTADEIFMAFDDAFGPGASDRVQILCRKADADSRVVIQELYVGLGGPIEPGVSLADLIQAAPPRTEATLEQPCLEGEVVKWE